jgi:hypothetical protein
MKPSDDELRRLQSELSLPYPPTLQTWHWRLAPSGDGYFAHEWADKPHRLLYDACAEVERLNAGYLERGAEIERLRKVAIGVAASLAAAISLLERGGKAAKKAAPSDKMFDQMLTDYRASLDRARAALGDAP